MHKELINKLKEACLAILPIVIIMIIINFSIPGFSVESNNEKFGPVLTSLLISALPLIIGTTLFSLGVEKSIAKLGEIVGQTLTKRKSIVLLLIIGGLLGCLVTLAEPDLSVLASRISPNGPDWTLIVVASIGVAIFMILSILRVVFDKKIKYWLVMGYGLIFTLALISDQNFLSIAFDSGGVTTGVVTVPFILALSMTVAKVLGGSNAEDDSFGYSGLCSMGTVLAVVVYSIVLKKTGNIFGIENNFTNKFNPINGSDEMMHSISSYSDLQELYLNNLISSIKDVAISMAPLLAFFAIFNIFFKNNKKTNISILVGFLYTFVGLVLFFLGAESGFIPFASQFGQYFAKHESSFYVFIICGFIFGFISMLAEPSVKILANNVSEVSGGVISEKIIYIALCLATGIAITLNTIRMNYNIDFIYFVIPLMLIALTLSFLTPEIYVGIAIDAAGVATGTMASCFFLPMSIGFSAIKYVDNPSFGQMIMKNGFGVVGIMSILPIIVTEIVGLTAVIKSKVNYKKALESVKETDDSQIIHLPS